jgi:hypothetical protein
MANSWEFEVTEKDKDEERAFMKKKSDFYKHLKHKVDEFSKTIKKKGNKYEEMRG